MNISIIIPTNYSLERQEIERWVKAWYHAEFPSFELIVSLDESHPFNKSRAINTGVHHARGSLLVICDADIVISIEQMAKGLAAGDWVIPFNRCFNLDQASTEQWLADGPCFDDFQTVKVRECFDRAGGIWIIQRWIFDMVGGCDERYEGWGGEDDSFCRAVNTLYKPLVMVPGDVYHFWHKDSYNKSRFMQSPNYGLWRQYCKATGDKEQMRNIIDAR